MRHTTLAAIWLMGVSVAPLALRASPYDPIVFLECAAHADTVVWAEAMAMGNGAMGFRTLRVLKGSLPPEWTGAEAFQALQWPVIRPGSIPAGSRCLLALCAAGGLAEYCPKQARAPGEPRRYQDYLRLNRVVYNFVRTDTDGTFSHDAGGVMVDPGCPITLDALETWLKDPAAQQSQLYRSHSKRTWSPPALGSDDAKDSLWVVTTWAPLGDPDTVLCAPDLVSPKQETCAVRHGGLETRWSRWIADGGAVLTEVNIAAPGASLANGLRIGLTREQAAEAIWGPSLPLCMPFPAEGAWSGEYLGFFSFNLRFRDDRLTEIRVLFRE